jgi:hypothetical protein
MLYLPFFCTRPPAIALGIRPDRDASDCPNFSDTDGTASKRKWKPLQSRAVAEKAGNKGSGAALRPSPALKNRRGSCDGRLVIRGSRSQNHALIFSIVGLSNSLDVVEIAVTHQFDQRIHLLGNALPFIHPADAFIHQTLHGDKKMAGTSKQTGRRSDSGNRIHLREDLRHQDCFPIRITTAIKSC